MRSVEADARPAIRVRPVPQCDPPFDDELMPELWATTQPTLFEWPVRRSAEPPSPSPPSALAEPLTHPSSTTVAASAGTTTSPPGACPLPARPTCTTTPLPAGPAGAARPPATSSVATAPPKLPIDRAELTGASPDARLAVRRFVSTCVEVFNGYRPAAHLRRMSAPKEAARVVAQGVAGARRIAELRRAARPGDRHTRRPGPVGVLGLRLCEPRQGAVEAAVLLVTGERTWAMALRLEQDERGWAATVLRLI
jgi:Family of unknown function (DUF6459)